MVLCSQSIVFAQTTYRTILKDADQAYEGYLGLHYLAVDAGFNNLSGASVWSIGAEGLYPINEKISAEVLALYSLLSLENQGAAFLFNAGGEFAFMSNYKERDVPVLLSFTFEDNYFDNTETQTWETVTLPTQVKREVTARGGLYLRRSAFEYVQGFTYYDVSTLTHAGLYAGVGMNWKHYLNFQTSEGDKAAAGVMFRPFFDLLVLPTKETVNPGQVEVSGTMGWRTGLTWVFRPYTKAENFGRKIRFFGNSIFRLEMGKRPLEGFYVTTGMGWAFKKFR
ncbi:MAG TPA: hypothetical protein DEQ34_04055 [Balneolaceae bacterium]|nr:hypothetical protein [Balneolaceae bacterium]|tara:strand:+ start:38482 stop:39324 length:843 start_codon:yes stop_codon:yes gene_type:complete